MAENERMVSEMEKKWEEKLAEAEKENKVIKGFLLGKFMKSNNIIIAV